MNPKDKQLSCQISTNNKGHHFESCWDIISTSGRVLELQSAGKEESSNEDHLCILREVSVKYVLIDRNMSLGEADATLDTRWYTSRHLVSIDTFSCDDH